AGGNIVVIGAGDLVIDGGGIGQNRDPNAVVFVPGGVAAVLRHDFDAIGQRAQRAYGYLAISSVRAEYRVRAVMCSVRYGCQLGFRDRNWGWLLHRLTFPRRELLRSKLGVSECLRVIP